MSEPLRWQQLGAIFARRGVRHWQALALSSAAAAAEATGIGLALPLLNSLAGQPQEQLRWLGAIAALVLIKAGLSYLAAVRLGRLRAEFGHSLQTRLQTALQQAEFARAQSIGQSRWQHAFEQVPFAVGCYQSYCGLQVCVLYALAYVLAVFWVSPAFALAALLVGGMVYAAFARLHRRTQSAAEQLLTGQQQLTSLAMQLLRGLRYLRATGTLPTLARERSAMADRVAASDVRVASLIALGQSLRDPLLLVSLLVLVAIQLTAGQAQLAAVLVALLLFYRAANALLAVQHSWQSVLTQAPALIEIDALIDTPPAPLDGSGLPSGDLRLVGVDFAFPGAPPLLSGVDWELRSGRWIALSGDSGIGKSTLFDLLLGLQRPQRGQIRVGDAPLDSLDQRAWRATIGFVPQEPWIKSDSLERNIALQPYGDPELHARRLSDACRSADLLTVIERLAEGLATKVGETGVELSGGERQRVAIARELYRAPRVLLLDEATSALDAASEARLLQALRDEQGDRCIVHASHRAAPLAMADEVWTLANGQLRLERMR